jgi:hypothetical protein
VDPAAEAAFDAPKRLAVLCGAALAAATLLVFPDPKPRSRAGWSRAQRSSALLALTALAGACLAALFSPRRPVSLDALRALGLFLPLGASRALDQGRWRYIAGAFLGGCAVNAFVSILQAIELYQSFPIEAIAGRTATGVLLGSEGHLALVLALAAPWPLGALLFGRDPALCRAGAALLAVILAGLLVNLSFTALGALLGWGPGTFAAEFVPHRLQAELRLRQRLLIPRITSTFGEAHCEVLPAAAELGLPAALAAGLAAAVLLAGLARACGREPRPPPQEALLLADLVTAAASALTWFPFQQLSAAPAILLVAGRAWRRLGPEEAA